MPSAARQQRRDFSLLFAVLLVVAAGNTALQSVLPAIGRELAIPDMLVAVIFSFSAVVWTLVAPFWAEQSDRRGRKALIEVGLAGFVVSMLLGAGVILMGLKAMLGPILVFVLFALSRSLFGLFGSASNPAAQAYIADRTSPGERTEALAMLASAFGLGTIIGPALAPFFVLPVVGLSGPLFVFTLIAAATWWLVRTKLPADQPAGGSYARGAPASQPSIGGAPTGASAVAATHGRRPRLSWRDPRIAPFMIYGFAVGNAQAATGQALGFLIIDRSGLPPAEAQTFIGLALMAGAGATLLAQWGLIRLLHLGPRSLMRWGAALAMAGTAAIALAPDLYALIIAFALASLGYGFARPGFTAGASLAVGEGDQGGVAGAITAINGSSFILAPAIGIALYQLARPLPYLAGAALLAFVLIYALRDPLLSRDGDRTPDPPLDIDP